VALNETLERIETGMSRMIGEVVREEGESDICDGPEPLGPAKIELDMMTVLAGFARRITAAAFLGARHRYPLYEVSLTFDGPRGRWVQENHTTGKRIELLYPWEILGRPVRSDLTFNDMREALEAANPLRARKAARP
jgi:hypothetical protein